MQIPDPGATPRFALPARQNGQALPEFIPLAIVFVPIFLLIPLLGKIGDMNQTTIQAARYGAWERTVSTELDKNDAQIQSEARKRFFGTNKIYIKTGDAPAANAPDNQYSVLWRDQAGGRMLKQFDNVNATLPNSSIPNGAVSLQAAKMRTDLEVIPVNDKWTVPGRGLYDSRFAVDVAPNRLPRFDRGTTCAGAANSTAAFTCISRHNAILADGWDSGTREMVIKRVERMVPMKAVAGPISTLSSVAGWVLPELKEFKPGYVEPDALPPDRLGGKVTYVP
jgi:hypothetical protein